MTISRMRARTLRSAAGIAAAITLVSLSGCVGYNVYPPMEGEGGFSNVNSDPFPQLMTESVRWVALRYPPNEHAEWNQPAAGNVGTTGFVINLPQGVNRMLGERIAKDVGMGAVPMLPGNEKMPTYSVARVWVQGDEAKVDIVRPVFNVAFDGTGAPVTQAITVRLRGGMEPWHVTSHRLWSFNSLQPPATNFLPGSQMAAEPMSPPAPAPKSTASRNSNLPKPPLPEIPGEEPVGGSVAGVPE